MKKNTNQNEKESATKKEAILNAALELFSQNGYGSTRLEAIAKKAGLSYGLAYYYFSSKDILFHIVAQEAIETAINCLYEPQDLSLSPYEELKRCTKSYLQWIDTDNGARSLMLLSNILTHQDIPEVTKVVVREKMSLFEQGIIALLERINTAENDVIVQNVNSTATLYHVLLIGFSFLHISQKSLVLPDTDKFLSILNIKI